MREAVALRASQDSDQDASVLPTLVVSEAVPREVKRWGSTQTTTASGVPLQLDEQPTNGVTYVTALMDVTDLPDRLVPYLDLFADFLTELGVARDAITKTFGAGGETQNGRRRRGTGHGGSPRWERSHARDGVPVRARARPKRPGDVRAHVRGGDGREMARIRRSSLAAPLPPRRLRRRVRRAERHAVRQGIRQRVHQRRRRVGPQDRRASARRAVAAIGAREGLCRRRGGRRVVGNRGVRARPIRVARCRVACQPGAPADAAVDALDAFLASMPEGKDATAGKPEPVVGDFLSEFSPAPSKAYVAVPSQTNYCAASFATVPYAHEDAAPLFLLGQAMSTEFLHRELREKGGAYGGGAGASPIEGVFAMSSYRDPGTTATVAAFAAAAEWAATKGYHHAGDPRGGAPARVQIHRRAARAVQPRIESVHRGAHRRREADVPGRVVGVHRRAHARVRRKISRRQNARARHRRRTSRGGDAPRGGMGVPGRGGRAVRGVKSDRERRCRRARRASVYFYFRKYFTDESIDSSVHAAAASTTPSSLAVVSLFPSSRASSASGSPNSPTSRSSDSVASSASASYPPGRARARESHLHHGVFPLGALDGFYPSREASLVHRAHAHQRVLITGGAHHGDALLYARVAQSVRLSLRLVRAVDDDGVGAATDAPLLGVRREAVDGRVRGFFPGGAASDGGRARCPPRVSRRQAPGARRFAPVAFFIFFFSDLDVSSSPSTSWPQRWRAAVTMSCMPRPRRRMISRLRRMCAMRSSS